MFLTDFWSQIQEIIMTTVVSVIGTFITILGTLLTRWLLSKINNDKARIVLEDALHITSDAVNYVHQTYVNSLKGTNLWDESAMREANRQATAYIQEHLSQEVIKYLAAQGQNIDKWIQEQIEIALLNSKKG